MGVHQSDTLYGAPSYEPIPDIKFEKDYSYTGGRDKNRLFHGKGFVEFSDGGYMEVNIYVRERGNFLIVGWWFKSILKPYARAP